MKVVGAFAAGTLIAAAALTPAATARPLSPRASETQVRAAVADLADAFTKGDPERASRHASRDLLLIHPQRGDVDYASFTGGMRQGLRPYPGYKRTVANIDSVAVSGNLAVVVIRWHTEMRDKAGKTSTRGERDQEVWRREKDGRWRLFRGASFPLPAPGYPDPK